MEHRVHVVVMAEAAVGPQPYRHRLVAAIHGHQVDVHVHEEVGLGRLPRDLHVLTLVGLPDVCETFGVLGVEVPEALRPERAEHPLPDDRFDLLPGHPAVERVRHQELHVLDATAGRQLEDLLQYQLPHVRWVHRRQGQRDVVERDREPHPRAKELRERLRTQRVHDRVPDRAADVGERRERVGRVHHPRAEREPLDAEALAAMHQQRRRPLVHLEHEARPGHESSLGSNATFGVPSRPALMAWSIASRQLPSGYVAPSTPSRSTSAATDMARSNAERRSPFTRSIPDAYAPITSSSRNHTGVRSAPATGSPASTTRPPARVVRRARSREPRVPAHSMPTSTPPRRNAPPRSGWSRNAREPRRTADTASRGPTTSVAPYRRARSR